MIYEVKGDLLQANEAFVAHQVNCRGVMGAGVAKQIKNKLLSENEFVKYKNMCNTKSAQELLGTILMHSVNNGSQKVVDLFAEDEPTGRKLDTDYEALYKSLKTLKSLAASNRYSGHSIAIPGYLGCGLAGGDWEYVFERILMPLFKDSDTDLTIYYNDDSFYQLQHSFLFYAKGDKLWHDWHGYKMETDVAPIIQFYKKVNAGEKMQRIFAEGTVSKQYAYLGVFDQTDTGVHVYIPDFQISVDGKNFLDSLQSASDAIKKSLSNLLTKGSHIPEPSDLNQIQDDFEESDIVYPIVVNIDIKPPVLTGEKLRSLCVANDWFTVGTIEQYDKLFAMAADGADINDLTLVIWLCSSGWSYKAIRDVLLNA